LFIIAIATVSLWATAAEVDPSRISAIVSAPQRGLVAIVYDEPHQLVIYRGAKVLTTLDIPAQIRVSDLSWSANAKYVALEYQITDDESSVRVVDLTRAYRVVDVGRGQQVRWCGNELVVVPDFGADELPRGNGLLLFDPSSERRRKILSKYHIAGPISVHGSWIATRVVTTESGRSIFSVLEYNLKTGRIAWILR
jgi:hypothetical protein